MGTAPWHRRVVSRRSGACKKAGQRHDPTGPAALEQLLTQMFDMNFEVPQHFLTSPPPWGARPPSTPPPSPPQPKPPPPSPPTSPPPRPRPRSSPARYTAAAVAAATLTLASAALAAAAVALAAAAYCGAPSSGTSPSRGRPNGIRGLPVWPTTPWTLGDTTPG